MDDTVEALAGASMSTVQVEVAQLHVTDFGGLEGVPRLG